MIRRMMILNFALTGKFIVHILSPIVNVPSFITPPPCPEHCATISFEYVKTVEAFNFNYNENPSNPGAKVSPLQPVDGADNFVCTNCWAYLGASAFVVVDWSGTSLVTAKVGVTGTAGFGFNLAMQGQGSGTQSL